MFERLGGAASFFRGGWPSGAGLAHTYVMTVWSMLEECAGQLDEPFRRSEMIGWFRRHHPDVNEATLGAHIQAATENAANRARNNPLGARPALLRRIDHGMYVRAGLPGEPAVDLAGQVDVPEPPGMDGVAADVILVGCVRTKRAGPCAAAELFTSPLFEGRHQYATASGLRWYVLSAKFGLLAPGDVIGPYDVYLADQSAGYRRAWGEFVTAALEQREGDLRGRTIEIHAGAAYVDPLRAPMAARGATLAVPLAHLRQGEQLAWYKKHATGSFSSTARPSPPGPMAGTGAGDLVRMLSDPSQALSPHELLGHGSRGLLAAGMYSWWVDEPGAADLSRGLGQPVAGGLIYAGQAGATRWPSGKRSGNTLWGRITGMHLGGAAEFSTFRRTLAAILRPVLSLTSEDDPQLSIWISTHLRVAAVPVPDADRLGELETAVLDALDPPLNLHGRPPTPIRTQLTGLRRSHGDDTADTPAPPEPAQPRLPRPGEPSLDQAERKFHQARRRPSKDP